MSYKFLFTAALTCTAAGGAYLYTGDYLYGGIFLTVGIVAGVLARFKRKEK